MQARPILALVAFVAFSSRYNIAFAQSQVGLDVESAHALPSLPNFEYTVTGGVLRGVRGDQTMWDYPLAEPEVARVVGPLQIGGRLYVCERTRLIALDAERGTVLDRWYLPGVCSALAADDQVAVATCAGGDQQRWTFQFRTGSIDADSAAMFAGPQGFFATRHQASIARELSDGDEAIEGHAASRLAQFRQRAEQDPTNPWHHVEAARYLLTLGRQAEARAQAELALTVPSRFAVDLTLAAPALDGIDPQLGDRAFALGLTELRRRGFEPDLLRSLVGAIGFLDRPGTALDPRRDYPALARHARRLAELAPHLEGSTHLYATLVDAALHHEGNDSVLVRARDAVYFAQLRDNTKNDHYFIVTTAEARYAGDLLNLLFAGSLALLLLTIAKSIGRKPSGTGWQQWNPLSRWTRAERVGLLLLGLSLPCIGWAAALGVAQIGVAAAAPMELAGGNLGHPAALLATQALNSEGDAPFIRALSLQQAGRGDEARALYAGLREPEAQTNLAALQHAGGPLACPTQAMWNRAIRAHVRHGDSALSNPVTSSIALIRVGDQISPTGSSPWVSNAVLFLIALLLTVLTLLPPYAQPGEAQRSRVAVAIDWLIPGASPSYGASGFLLLAAILTGVYGAWFLASTDGQSSNVLDAIATPNFAGYFGLAELAPRASGSATWYYTACALLGIHVVWMAWQRRRKTS